VRLQARGDDLLGKDVDADVILAGDVFYERDLAERAIRWLHEAAARGATVLIADPGRGYLDPARLRRVGVYDAPYDGEIAAPTLRPTPIYCL
jgi:predicted nicotinamide N-methyase